MTRTQDDVRARGEEIFRLMEAGPPVVFDKKRLAGLLMNLAMADADLKLRLFRFVDVLPALDYEGTGHLSYTGIFSGGRGPCPPPPQTHARPHQIGTGRRELPPNW